MSEPVSPEAGRQAGDRKGAVRRQGAKPSGGTKRKGAATARVQFHLAVQVVERLRVHSALSHASDSGVVGGILLAHLSRFGKGRELFPAPAVAPDESGEDALPV